MKKKLNKKRGFTLIEISIAIFIASVLVVTILVLFIYALRTIADNKLFVQGITFGEEKLEIIKNLPYNLVGTVGGIPAGTLPQNENATINGTIYQIQTFISYYDDPADGILGIDPSEISGTDYKKVRIQISWESSFGQKSQAFVTNIAPKRNQNANGTGTLAVLVFDASGNPVPQTQVAVKASFATTTVDITAQTNNQGKLILPGSPAGMNKYLITATKTGYSADRTCAIDALGNTCTDAVGNPNPTKPYASVIEYDYTEVSLAIDLLSQFNITTIRQAVPTEWTINTDSTSYDQDNPSTTVCANGNYIFSWRDYRQSNNPRIYAQMYNPSRIAQWNPDLAVTTSNNQNNPDLGADNNCNIYVVWNDDRNGNQDVYFNKYNSSAIEAWGGSKKINTSADSADQTFGQIIINASSTYEYIVWLDARNDTNDIYAQKFDNSGNQIWGAEIRVNSDISNAAQALPKIKIEPMQVDSVENIYFAWHDNRNNDNDIFIQKYNNSGLKIWPSDIKANTDSSGSDQKNPDFILSKNGYLYVAWQDNRLGNYDIYMQKYSSTSSAAVWPLDIKINSDTGSAFQENPSIAEDTNGNFYAVWEDTRNGNADIYLQKIDADGTKLISFDVPVNGIQPNEQSNPDIFLNTSGYLVIAWQDNNAGNFDIKAGVYNGDPQDITIAPNIPFNMKGAKKIGENPVIYKYDNNHSTNSAGNLSISNIEWDIYTIIPTGYTLLRTEPASPINVNPNSTVNITAIIQ